MIFKLVISSAHTAITLLLLIKYQWHSKCKGKIEKKQTYQGYKMENSIYIALSKQAVIRNNMGIVANNIANMNTTGYRGQNLLFKEYISQPRGMEYDISQVYDYGQYQNAAPGPMQRTGNKLDVALEGGGFFGIITNDGIKYSRAGSFSINSNGELVNSNNDKVASSGGGPINIPQGTIDISIAENGNISADGSLIGQIMIHEFDNY